MTEGETHLGDDNAESEPKPATGSKTATKPDTPAWLEIVKAVTLPLVTLVLGFLFNTSLNSRQDRENNIRLYTEMMGHREDADSALRKDMFQSILATFLRTDEKRNPLTPKEQLDQDVLNLELLAYNFHEALDLAPLFKHVRRRIPDELAGAPAELRSRLEKVAQEVIQKQVIALSYAGMVQDGDSDLQKLDTLQAYISFGSNTVSDPKAKPGDAPEVSRLCLSMDSTDGGRHYRQFKLEVTGYDPRAREVQVRLYASRVLDAVDCHQWSLDLVANRDIDTSFSVGLFDFPLIDNTHLSDDERCAVAVKELTAHSLKIDLVYFPGSRAGLKDKPYYDEVVHHLLGDSRKNEH